MSKMTQLGSAIEELNSLSLEIAQTEKKKHIHKILEKVGLGFLLYRNVDRTLLQYQKQRILLTKDIESANNEASEYLKMKLKAIEVSGVFLSQDQQEELLNWIRLFENNLEHLKTLNTLDSKLVSSLIDEAKQSKQFVVEYNDKLERKILKQKIIKLKEAFLQAENDFTSLYDRQQYFSKRELESWKKQWKNLVPLAQQCNAKGVTEIEFQGSLDLVTSVFNDGQRLLKERNESFVEKEILRSDLFEKIDGHTLSEEQRRAIVVDEANTLVVAGAGTGKSTTLFGKAFYLISKKLATPEEVLLIAFNTDVVEKNERKINVKHGINFTVKTYHRLGLDIIGQATGERPTVSPLWEDKRRLELRDKILDFVKSRMGEENFAKSVLDYFLVYYSSYKSIFDFKSLGEYYQYLKENEVRALKGHLVRSFEECDIANFLYVNGINYLYEEDYKFKTADAKHRQYKPDFFLPDYDIYIEHFGIDKDEKPAPWISKEVYKEEMEWKERTHEENGTTLIRTYSYEKKDGKLLSNLQSSLLEKGVLLKPLPQSQIFEKINSRKINSLASLLSSFLNLFKSCGKSLDALKSEVGHDDIRRRTFLDIFSTIYEDYSEYLDEKNHIDFNDMINDAATLIEQRKFISPFKYILVDEFQDIAQSRYRFLKALIEQNNAKLFCVGDDWQSIYRFTGGDISIMVDFKTNFGFSERLFVRETYRFGNKLADFSTKFILENSFQIPKEIISNKEEDKPAVTIIKDTAESALKKVANEISLSSNKRKDSMYDREKLWILNRYKEIGRPENLRELIIDHPEIEIEYKTAHSSKGQETDYVAIIGLRNGVYGFPCQIEDDPILNLVLAKPEPVRNAEERRLFYVALTRAQKHVYLVVDKPCNASEFVTEIETKGYEFDTIGEKVKTFSCPICRTGIIIEGNKPGRYECSNSPYCNYSPKRCPECGSGFLHRDDLQYRCSNKKCSFLAKRCPICEDGYLVPRVSAMGPFYGCSNWSSTRCKGKETEL